MSTQSSKSQVLVVGAGRLGAAVVRRLQASGRYGVIIADPHRDTLQSNRERGIEGVELCGTQYLPILKNAMQNVAAVVCAAPDFVALDVARAARECGCHYLDASENPATRSQIAVLAADALDDRPQPLRRRRRVDDPHDGEHGAPRPLRV